MPTKYSIQDMQAIAKQHNGLCLSEEYRAINKRLLWKCQRDHIWKALPSSIVQGAWCFKCANINKRDSIEVMHTIAEQREGRCLSTEYLNAHTPMQWECSEGHTWQSNANNIKSGRWCPKCADKIRAEKRKNTIEDMQILAKKHEGKCLSTVYIDANTKLRWSCDKGHIFEKEPADIQQGRWCTRCPILVKRFHIRGNVSVKLVKRYSIEDMCALAAQKRGKCLSGVYETLETKLRWQCDLGHAWEATPQTIQTAIGVIDVE